MITFYFFPQKMLLFKTMNTDEILSRIYNAFEPNLPATPSFYLDCREARGGDILSDQIIKRLRMSQTGHPLRFLFTGHIGSGKTSELKNLELKLKETTTFPVYIDFKDYLDEEDTKLEDIFLAIAIEIAYSLKDAKASNESIVKWTSEKLKDSYIGGLIAKAKDYIINEAEIDDMEVGLPFDIAKVKLKRLKQTPTARDIIHKAIRQERTSLLSELNLLIDQANLFLKENTSFLQMIIIADGLEKIEKFEGKGRGLESHHQLFIESQTQLTAIVANIVYTIPLSLYRSSADAPKLSQYYGNESFVLPMVKIHKRGNCAERYEKGFEVLKAVMKKRLANHIKLEEAFAADALDYLITYSGGSIRNLMRFVQGATYYTDELPIKLSAVKKEVDKSIDLFANSVSDSNWEKLADLELSKRQQVKNGDRDYAEMLENTTIFEYLNGDDNQAENRNQRWYAVNPCVRETDQFKDAVEAKQQ
jgi:hypothetical protein